VIDTLRSAAEHGAKVFNYAMMAKSQRDADGWLCDVQDRLTNDIFRIRARVVVNATGAWADLLPASRVPLRLTKGAHLVIDRTRLPINDAIVMTDENRILFAIPWGKRVILGTTDTDYDGDRDAPICDRADAEYILRITNASFPTAALTFAAIKSTWAGLRPLIDGGKSGAPSDISRKHLIEMTEPGWIDVAGGKLTTYRLMAEQTVDRILSHLNLDARPCATATTPLLAPFSGVVPPDVTRDAVEHFCSNEWAVHLDDVMTRRTSWRHYVDDLDAVAEQVSRWMSEILDWDGSNRQEEIASFRSLLHDRLEASS
jgi:glycerol-3-phosphate dehydrogenase